MLARDLFNVTTRFLLHLLPWYSSDDDVYDFGKEGREGVHPAVLADELSWREKSLRAVWKGILPDSSIEIEIDRLRAIYAGNKRRTIEMKEKKKERNSKALLWLTALALLSSNLIGLRLLGPLGFVSFLYRLIWKWNLRDINHLYGTSYPMFFVLTLATAVYCGLKIGWRRLTLMDVDPALIFYLCVVSAAYLLVPFSWT